MMPVQRILGVPESASRTEILQFAERNGLASVAVHGDSQPDGWYGQIKVADITLNSSPVSTLIRRLPRVDHRASKLDALHILCEAGETHAIVRRR